jgi:hypothetical protein
MTASIVLAVALLAVLLAAALIREVRIRRALEQLLARLLHFRRNSNEEHSPRRDAGDHSAADPGAK